MPQPQTDLEKAFSDDHRVLGAGFHNLSQWLRARDLKQARAAACRLDEEAGGHIAFEEEHFYPKLGAKLGEETIHRLYAEHDEGLAVIERLCDLPMGAQLSRQEWSNLLANSEAMEVHIAECGALFEALRGMPTGAQDALHRKLLECRRRHPTWRQHAKARDDAKAVATTSR